VVDLPLLIGTIPLSSSFNILQNQNQEMQGATAPPAPWQQNSVYSQLRKTINILFTTSVLVASHTYNSSIIRV
jgi:hypothetical protein